MHNPMLNQMLEWQFLASASVALFAALAGSLHCIGMCGPLRLLTGSSRSASLRYQGGRLAAYLLLGAGAGAIGFVLPPWALYLMVALALSYHFVPPRFLPSSHKIKSVFSMAAAAGPGLIGFASGLIPCGMLHAWVATAAITKSPLSGALMLGALWLGTLPALELSSRSLRRPMEKLRLRFPKAMPIALILLALAPISLRSGWNTNAKDPKMKAHCHHASAPELPAPLRKKDVPTSL